MDAQENKRLLWLVGAGASCEAGYPLVSEYFRTSYYEKLAYRELYAASGLKLAKSFSREAGSWAGGHEKTINQLIDDLSRDNNAYGVKALNRFSIRVLMGTLERNRLGNWDCAHMYGLAAIMAGTASDIISLNYDTLIEEQLTHVFWMSKANAIGRTPVSCAQDEVSRDLESGDFPYRIIHPSLVAHHSVSPRYVDYGTWFVPSVVPRCGMNRLAKPHGSITFIQCSRCGASWYSPMHFILTWSEDEFKPCPDCGGGVEPIFVPPSGPEAVPDGLPVPPDLWSDCEEMQRDVGAMVLLGYSLPSEDIKSREYLLRVGEVSRDVPVFVVDPAPQPDSAKWLKTVFSSVCHIRLTTRGFVSSVIGTMLNRTTGYKWLKPYLRLESLDSARLHLLQDTFPPKRGSNLRMAHNALMLAGCSESLQEDVIKIAEEETSPAIRGWATALLGEWPSSKGVISIARNLLDFALVSEVSEGSPFPQRVSSYARSAAFRLLEQEPDIDVSPIYAASVMTGQIDQHEGHMCEGVLMMIKSLPAMVACRRARSFENAHRDNVAVGAYGSIRSVPRTFANVEEIDVEVLEARARVDERGRQLGRGKNRFEPVFLSWSVLVLADWWCKLLWNCYASTEIMKLVEIKAAIERTNAGGPVMWRLPTVAEVASLLEGERNRWGLLGPKDLGIGYEQVLTSDTGKQLGSIIVSFDEGRVGPAWTFEYGDVCRPLAVCGMMK